MLFGNHFDNTRDNRLSSRRHRYSLVVVLGGLRAFPSSEADSYRVGGLGSMSLTDFWSTTYRPHRKSSLKGSHHINVELSAADCFSAPRSFGSVILSLKIDLFIMI